ncbi:MAG: STAS domain-containing protein [Leptolyngbya sp. RL_3_1]|nr:STAS domain-containing protein [Leptolyngbya sp. RL_3_1]
MARFQQDVMVIQPSLPLSTSAGKDWHNNLSEQVISGRATTLMVDMSQVHCLDNAGLVSLLTALRLAHHRQKRLCLCSVPPAIRMVLELAQLDHLFEIVEPLPLQQAA